MEAIDPIIIIALIAGCFSSIANLILIHNLIRRERESKGKPS